MEHLVYCDKKEKVLEKLLNGTKTMIIRGAAGRKCPHSRVFAGETAFFIENDGSGKIVAKGKIKSVFNSEKMTEEESKSLVEKNKEQLQLSAAQEKRWAGKKVLVLVEIEDVKAIETMKLAHQKNMDDWLIVEHIEDILEGSEKKYENVRLQAIQEQKADQ